MMRLYLIAAAAIGSFAWMAGDLRAPSAPKPGEAAAVGDPEKSDNYYSAKAAAPAGALVLDRRGDGHFYAQVDINGSPIEMLVDTGASGVALSADDAKRAGIATSIGMREQVGQGAGGAVYGDFVKIDRIRLGDVEASSVPAVILNGGSQSLLGQSVLRQFATVEISNDRMILK